MKIIHSDNLEFAPLNEPFSFQPGNGSAFEVVLCLTEHGLVVGVFGKGAYRFQTFAHPDYVSSKLNLLEGDAVHFSNLINAHL